jgi:phosphoglycolate phosphatase-like HAD superfamily hydrolase
MDLARWRPALIMFDLDGTLVDTMHGFADIASLLIHERFGVELRRARELYFQTSGVPFRQQLEEVFPCDTRNELTAETYENRKGAVCARAVLPAATTRMLERLKQRQLWLVVSSNSAQHFVDEFNERSPYRFDLALGHTADLAKGEPHVARVVSTFGVEREAMLFVGDSLKDGELARDCGQRFVAVAGTFTAAQFHSRDPLTPVLNQASELYELIFPDSGARPSSP